MIRDARRRRILAISSRASDHVELAELSVELARRGHHVHLVHLYSESSRIYHESTIADCERINREHPNIEARAVDADRIAAPALGKHLRRLRMPKFPRLSIAWLARRPKRPRPVQPPKPPGKKWETRFIEWLDAKGRAASARLHADPRYRKAPPWAKRLLQINIAAVAVIFVTPIHVPRLTRRLTRRIFPDSWKAWLAAPIHISFRARRSFNFNPRIVLRHPREYIPQHVKQVLVAMPMLNLYRRFLRYFRREIREHRIDVLLLPEDVVGYTWPLLIKAGHEKGIPSLVFPYTLANREEPLRSLKDAEHFQTRLNPPMARMFKRWRWQDETMDIMRLPFEHVFAHEMLRVSPPDPWTMNSGFANRICVDSPASYEYFKDAGIPASKMEVTGSASQDKMQQLRARKAESLRELRATLGLEGDKPLLLVSGAPEQLAGEVPGCEFPTMEAIGDFVGECLQPLGELYHLVVRPHPNYARFGAMLEPWGFRSTDIPTSRLVPIADLFVAFASSTIRWAISCAVPTVNYDVFHYGYGDFAAARGVHSVQGKEEFRDAVARLTPGSAAYADLAARIAADSAQWSMMDGHCVDRIEAAIQRECGHWLVLRTSH
jgi:hypothetical protein